MINLVRSGETPYKDLNKHAEWLLRNRERLKEYRRNWEITNKDKRDASKRAYRKANHEKLRTRATERARERYTEDEEYRKVVLQRNQLRHRGYDSKMFEGQPCFYCGSDNRKATVDHLVPQSQGGSNDISNLVPSCRQCNASKGANSLEVWYQIKELVCEF